MYVLFCCLDLADKIGLIDDADIHRICWRKLHQPGWTSRWKWKTILRRIISLDGCWKCEHIFLSIKWLCSVSFKLDLASFLMFCCWTKGMGMPWPQLFTGCSIFFGMTSFCRFCLWYRIFYVVLLLLTFLSVQTSYWFKWFAFLDFSLLMTWKHNRSLFFITLMHVTSTWR